jgi:hypothetical protein
MVCIQTKKYKTRPKKMSKGKSYHPWNEQSYSSRVYHPWMSRVITQDLSSVDE